MVATVCSNSLTLLMMWTFKVNYGSCFHQHITYIILCFGFCFTFVAASFEKLVESELMAAARNFREDLIWQIWPNLKS